MSDNLALIIDDDPKLVELLALAVESTLGCRIITAENGEVGLYEARKQMPNFILLDWIMPEKTGLEVLDDLQDDPATSSIPVYMITRKTRMEDIKRAKELGCVGYFLKPIDFDIFCLWLIDKFPTLAKSHTKAQA
jgi:twitching motility two-component system response regulator PilH